MFSGIASVTTIRSSGEQHIWSAIAIGTTISSGGAEVVESGGITSNTRVSSGGVLMYSPGPARSHHDLQRRHRDRQWPRIGASISGGTQHVRVSGATVSGGLEIIVTGGTASASRRARDRRVAGQRARRQLLSGGVIQLLHQRRQQRAETPERRHEWSPVAPAPSSAALRLRHHPRDPRGRHGIGGTISLVPSPS